MFYLYNDKINSIMFRLWRDGLHYCKVNYLFTYIHSHSSAVSNIKPNVLPGVLSESES